MSTGFNLTRAHIEQALAKIDRDGIPPRRNSKVYDLLKDNKKYPVKIVVDIAHDIAGLPRPKGEDFNSIVSKKFFEANGYTVLTDKKQAHEEFQKSRLAEPGKACPECGHPFQGNGWDGIDAHWRKNHANIVSYEEAWPLIQAGTYHEEKQRREADRDADLKDLEAVVKDLDAIDKDPDLSPTEREVKGKARVGQSAYRKQMLELWGGKCAVTGCDLQSMLIASHAKAWAASSSKEKLDPYNGVPLVPTLDRLFDKHLISFHPEAGDMLLAREIDTRERRMQLGISTVEKSLRKAPNKQQAAYLRHHFEAFMKKQRDKAVA